MRRAATSLAVLASVSLVGPSIAAEPIDFILRENMLPPVAYTIFCTNYPLDCSAAAPSAAFLITDPRLLFVELEAVNREVNFGIQPASAKAKSAVEARWTLFPSMGDCNDYVVSKRHALLSRGWPSSALLLAEVALQSGEHHLVLVANVGGSTYVLDNLRPDIVPLTSSVEYRWIRIESPQAPQNWVRIGPTTKERAS
jgi:predicted transglutaminase-like cysteine proteinase